MRVLIDINHPADIHLFKNFVWIMQRRGHDILFTTRRKEITTILLDKYGFKYILFGKNYKSLIGKSFGLFKYDIQLFNITRKYDPDIIINSNSIYACHVSYILGKKHIAFVDTDNAKKQIALYKPFAQTVVTPSCIPNIFGIRQIKYDGYHEIAYLHPNYFAPDTSIVDILGVKKNEKYIILRFVSWNASHDFGHSGLTLENKRRVVREFSKYAKVFISSESELPNDLKKYQISIIPEKMHDALFYATLLYGESATMASECAVLGTPSIYLDNVGRRYTDEEEKKYNLVFNYTESLEDQEKSIKKGIELLNTQNNEKVFKKRCQKMFSDKIDVTAFMVWFIKNYPESVRIMKGNPGEIEKRFHGVNPEYQERFKQDI